LQEGDSVFLGLDVLVVRSVGVSKDPKIYLESKIKIPPALLHSEDQWGLNTFTIHSELGSYSRMSYKFDSTFDLNSSLALNSECKVKDVRKVFVFEAKEEKNSALFFLNSCRLTLNSFNEITSEKVLLVLVDGKTMTESEILDKISKKPEFYHLSIIELNNKSVCDCDEMISYVNGCYKRSILDSQVIFVATISVFGFIIAMALTCNAFKNQDQIKKFFGRLTKRKQRRLFRRVNRIKIVME
jgi:hypothetical protein